MCVTHFLVLKHDGAAWRRVYLSLQLLEMGRLPQSQLQGQTPPNMVTAPPAVDHIQMAARTPARGNLGRFIMHLLTEEGLALRT